MTNTTLKSKVEKSKRARLMQPPKDSPTTVTFSPKTGRPKTSNGIPSRDS